MTDSNRREWGDDASVPGFTTERSPLTRHPDSTAAYGINASPSDTDYDSSSEDSSLLSRPEDEESSIEAPATPVKPADRGPYANLSPKAILWIILPMLLAVFIANADASIVMATHAIIASEFMALESSSWLFTGFMLASTATQTTFGQLSQVFGRKPIILVCYAVFGLGCLLIGTANSMAAAIAGRLLSGSVSAGTNVLVSLVITDLVPVREVASWNSYVNVVAVIGRCVGGPLGGGLADMIGWRMSFVGQAPIFLIAIILCWATLPNTKAKRPGKEPEVIESKRSKLSQVDFLGSALLVGFLILILLPMEIGGRKVAWSDPCIPILFGSGAVCLILFVVAEKYWAVNPLLPLSLFCNRHTVAAFFIIALQLSAQLGMMYSVPLYFQVTQKMSNTAAGAHLLPAVIGNAVGGIMSGYFIRNTGKYKWLIYLATLMSATSYILLLLRWHGKTNWIESLYIFPGGFGTGVALSAVFIAVQASVDKARLAPAVSTLYLCQGFGAIVGLAAVSAAFQAGLRSTLQSRLVEMHLDADLRNEIIAKAVASVDYIFKAKGEIAHAVTESYVDGLWYSHIVSLGASLLAFALIPLLREYKL
ncbi:Vacuolar membrane amino acid uptake transporter fnx2 [Cytospora mali]|uniref:Vacuolar membrane amino acid uptake transporter fnx2 n=1 Tax=Cytospora mali TaxID=578113 RepID=A0A194UZR8_CYTMA|nr:Vacuolar membrane amino acid uptake transporter fnx2 [Valsa mali var. pyri (nom. inval.)]